MVKIDPKDQDSRENREGCSFAFMQTFSLLEFAKKWTQAQKNIVKTFIAE